MNPEIKAIIDARRPRLQYEKIKELDEKVRSLRKRLTAEALKEGPGTAQDLECYDYGRWFLCSRCFFGMDDYYSNDEGQMPDNSFNFCPCCGAKIDREEATT